MIEEFQRRPSTWCFQKLEDTTTRSKISFDVMRETIGGILEIQDTLMSHNLDFGQVVIDSLVLRTPAEQKILTNMRGANHHLSSQKT
jgi:hypothetical protein